MEIASTATEYDRLIARHHAMRLRRQILAPAPSSAGTPHLGPPHLGAFHPGARYSGPHHDGVPRDSPRYDGAADQRLILRTLGEVAPFAGLIDHLCAVMFHRRPYLRARFPASMDAAVTARRGDRHLPVTGRAGPVRAVPAQGVSGSRRAHAPEPSDTPRTGRAGQTRTVSQAPRPLHPRASYVVLR